MAFDIGYDSSTGETTPQSSSSKANVSAGGYFYTGYDTPSGNPLVGYGSSGVTKIVSGKAGGGGRTIYSTKEGVGLPVNPVSTPIKPTYTPSVYSSSEGRIRNIRSTEAGLVNRRAGVVRVSSGVYNKVMADRYGVNSPYRRATDDDITTLSSDWFEAGATMVDRGSGRWDDFKVGALELLPYVNAEVERKSKQEEYFASREAGTGVGVLRSVGSKLGSFSDTFKAKYDNVSGVTGAEGLRGSLGAGYLLTGLGSKLFELPSRWSRDVLMVGTGGGMFNTGERVVAGINTGIRIATLGYGVYSGATLPSAGKLIANKVLLGASVFGLGVVGYDVATTPSGKRSDKILTISSDIIGLGALGSFGGGVGADFNPYYKAMSLVDGRVDTFYGGRRMVSNDFMGGKVIRNFNDNTAFYDADGYVSTTYKTLVPQGRVDVLKGVGTGGSTLSGVKVGSKFYSTGKYSGLSNDFYVRGVSSTKFGSFNFYKGDALVYSTGRVGGLKPSFYIGEQRIFYGKDSLFKANEFTDSYKRGGSVDSIITGVRGKYEYTGFSEFRSTTETQIITKGFMGTGGLGKAHITYLKNPVFAKGELIGADAGFSKPISTKYIPVDYVPKPKVGKVLIRGGELIYSKPSTSFTGIKFDVGGTTRVSLVKTGTEGWGFMSNNIRRGINPLGKSTLVDVNEVYTGGFSGVVTPKTGFVLPSTSLIRGGVTPVGVVYPSIRSRLNVEPVSRVSGVTANIVRGSVTSRSYVDIRNYVGTSVVSNPKIVVGTTTINRIVTGDVTPSPSPSITPSITPNPITTPTFIPSLYGLIGGLGWGGRRRGDLFASPVFNPKYTSTLEAVGRGVRGSKPSKFLSGSGVAIRPLVKIGKGSAKGLGGLLKL